MATVTPASDPNSAEAKQKAKEAEMAATTGQPQWMVIAQSQYGYMAAFAQDPELGPLLQKAAEHGWTQEVLNGQVFKTNWWRTHAEPARKWVLLTSTDPAEAKRQVSERYNELKRQAGLQGFHIDDKSLHTMATTTLAFGLNETMTQQMLFSQAKFTGRAPARGIAGEHVDQIRQRAADFGVNVSDGQAFDFAQKIAMGTYSMEGVDTELRNHAKSQWGILADELNSGKTVREALGANLTQYAQLMEIDPAHVNVSDPGFRQFVQGWDDKGHRRLLSAEETGVKVRQTADWRKTRNAHDQFAAVGQQILETFGKVS